MNPLLAWRLGAAAAAAAGVLLLGWWAYHTVWERGYDAKAAEVAVEDAKEARFVAQLEVSYRGKIERQAKIAEETKRAYEAQIGDARATAGALARRLSDVTRRLQASAVSASTAGACGVYDPAGESGYAGRIERAVEAHFAACAADRVKLTSLQDLIRKTLELEKPDGT